MNGVDERLIKQQVDKAIQRDDKSLSPQEINELSYAQRVEEVKQKYGSLYQDDYKYDDVMPEVDLSEQLIK